METLRLLVQNLIIIVVLAIFLEMLLPEGEMRRYTKMVMGLMVIVAVVQAIGGITRGNLFSDIEEYAWRVPPGPVPAAADALGQGRKLHEDNRKQALEQYKKGLEKQISALVGLDGRLSLVGADINVEDDPAQKDFGRIKEVRLRLGREGCVKPVEPVTIMVGGEGSGTGQSPPPPPEFAGAADKAARVVANFYNLPAEKVKVEFVN